MQQKACIDHFDLIDCGSAFNFCAEELMVPYEAAGRLVLFSSRCIEYTELTVSFSFQDIITLISR